ncbi:MAG: hypothetical protein KIC77_07790 [Clostridiales bacterium]|nr:hypothetical protein [Clostridiales bacterium]
MKKNVIMRIAMFLLCMALVAGIYTFIVIPSVRKEQKEIYEKKLAEEMYHYVTVLTYNGDTPLLSETIITEAIESCFDTIKMPAGCITSDYVSDFNDICGLQLKYAICKGQQVSFQNFKEFLKDSNGNEKLKEFQICSLVAGQAMPGRFADILLRYPNGNAAVVVPKIQIYDIQRDTETKSAYLKDKKQYYTAVFAVDDEEYNDLVDASKEGVLDIRIYLDAAQEASAKTYYPAAVLNGV